MTLRQRVIAVVGSGGGEGSWGDDLGELAAQVGGAIAATGFATLTGGHGGVMLHAAAGASRAGGLTLGILASPHHRDGNAALRIALPTPFGIGRNVLTACACDAMVALRGGTGTWQEVLFALDFGRPVLSLGGPRHEHPLLEYHEEGPGAVEHLGRWLREVGRRAV